MGVKVKVPEGLEVKFSHLRLAEGSPALEGGTNLRSMRELREAKLPVSAKGGRTLASILDGEKVVATGVAQCNAKDPFNYRIGRDIALGRAIKELEAKHGG